MDNYISRTRQGKNSFIYTQTMSKIITDKVTLERITKLHIPPAWTKVKISTNPTDYLQVTGEDSKGRVQYLYHPAWVELSRIEKYSRMKNFISKIPLLIKNVNQILKGPLRLQEPEYIIAILIKILLKTHTRIGNDCYSEETRGLTTLLKKHMILSSLIKEDVIIFSFIGKKNIKQHLEFKDHQMSQILRELRKIPGDRLFKTSDLQIIRSQDVNDYIKKIMGEEFTAKDFRTWGSNIIFLEALNSLEKPVTITETKRNINKCLDIVADKLGNTRAVCRTSYVMPEIIEKYLQNPEKKITLDTFIG